MPASRFALAAVALAVAATACSGIEQPSAAPPAHDSPGPTVVAGASGSPGVGEPSGPPTPVPTIDPTLARKTIVSCGSGGLHFSAELLLQPGRAELGTDAPAAQLQTLVNGPDGAANGLPRVGWFRVDAPPSQVLFVAPSAEGWSQVVLRLDPAGWTPDEYGSCALRPVLPAGVGWAAWWVDPKAGAPAADGTTVRALLREEACASGKTPAGRVVGPAFLEDATRVIVTFGVRPRKGDQDCQGSPSFALQFTLPTPLGGRTLLDGGVFPPRDALSAPD